jgi:drug/metabolite transporter (DMT)-like permease
MPQPRPLDRVAIAAMLLLCVSWGLQYVATKVALAAFPPLEQSGLRSVLATFIVGGVAAWREPRLWIRDGTGAAGVAAGLLFSAMIIAIYVGLQWTTAARVIVFVYTAPIFVALGGIFLLPDQRLRTTQWVGMAVALLGVMAAVVGEGDEAGRSIVGDALALAGGIAWAATTLLIKASALRSTTANQSLSLSVRGFGRRPHLCGRLVR